MLLSLLIFVPFVLAGIALFIPTRFTTSFRLLSLSANIVQLFLAGKIILSYEFDGGFQLVEKVSWISLSLGSWGQLQADYFVALDGLSFPLVLLSVFILLIATLTSWKQVKNAKGYFILLLILNGAIIGSFCALDFLLFYVFFEFMLLPMYFLIGIWGGPNREYASIKFFLYTLLGSILILIVLIGLYLSVQTPGDNPVHTFNVLHMQDMNNFIPDSVLDPDGVGQLGFFNFRQWAFLLLLVGFLIKLPAVPFHTWLPDAHVEASTPVSVILAALLLKFGGYGLLRFVYPVFPDSAVDFSLLVGLLGLISIIYGALNALASKDLKRLIAYSSVSHMGFVLLGIAAATVEGITGAVYQMVSHGIISALLFVLAGVIYDRTQDRIIDNYSGLATKMKSYTAFILIGFFASMGLPGFAGFIGEVLIFFGAFQSHIVNGLIPAWLPITATLGLLLAAGYYLWTIQRMFFGPFAIKNSTAELSDLNTQEYLVLVPLALAALLFGVLPQLLLNYINPFAADFVNTWFAQFLLP